jgi:hypothetical protein
MDRKFEKKEGEKITRYSLYTGGVVADLIQFGSSVSSRLLLTFMVDESDSSQRSMAR